MEDRLEYQKAELTVIEMAMMLAVSKVEKKEPLRDRRMVAPMELLMDLSMGLQMVLL